MRRTSLFALVAVAPAALNVSAWAAPTTVMRLCSDNGSSRWVVLAGLAPHVPDTDERQQCPKGCHAGPARTGRSAGSLGQAQITA